MKNLKKFNELLKEGFFDAESVNFLSSLGSVIKDTLSSSVNPGYDRNETELTGAPEPGGSTAESPYGKGIPLEKSISSIKPGEYDSFGSKLGITDKSDKAPLEQPSSGPIGNLVNSAYANINTSTRGIPATDGGNLGCAAATSIMFYRATGYPIAANTKVVIGTSTVYDDLNEKSKDPTGPWKKITDWKKDYKPGDIIITRRRSRAGHIGIVVNGGKIISNSSSGFNGDKMGQIEENYTISSWEKDVAKRNPSETAIFRYQGPYKSSWS
jgi:cell wall-associated NlpC family hydrolase